MVSHKDLLIICSGDDVGMDNQPELSRKVEIAGFVVEAVAGVVPLAGGAITAAVIPAMQKRHARRMKLWLDTLASSIEQLQLDVRGLSTDDRFLDTLIAATNAATNTAHAEKVQALRNAVLNSAETESRPDEEMSVRFIRLVDEMNPTHLRLMSYFEDPKQWFDREVASSPPGLSTHRGLALIAMGWDRAEEDRLGWLLEDLVTWRVLGVLNSTNGTGTGLLEVKNLTSLGRAFMAYIRDPELTNEYPERS